jgi:hypothetical protein
VLIPLEIPAGMVRAGTTYQAKGRWVDGSRVRFFANTIQPIGGWREVSDTPLEGRPCGMFGWRSNPANYALWLAVGTNTHLYVYDNEAFFDITPADFVAGSDVGLEGRGWGRGGWGLGPWGIGDNGIDGRRVGIDVWHFDAWGENLVACYTADGRLLEWSLATGTPAQVIANAPTDCVGVFTSNERILIALGAGGDSRKVAWSDQEDNTAWTAAANNAAGDLQISTDGVIVTGFRVMGENLIVTTTDVHRMRYIGAPFYYSIEQVAANCGIVSANAKVFVDTFAVWMSPNGFKRYNGYVESVPCDVHDGVFADINPTQFSKVTAGHNGEFGEVWWFYCSAGSSENDRYVVWNYRENHWTLGALDRCAWIDKGVWVNPIAADADGYIYQHEYENLANFGDRGAYLVSGPVELGNGDQVMHVNQVLHDESQAVNALSISFLKRFAPEGSETIAGPYVMGARDDGYTDVRFTARQAQIKLEEAGGEAWRLGALRLDARPGGRR